MVNRPKIIKVGILLVGLCLILIFNSYKQKLNYDNEMAKQTTILFLNSLAKHDRKSAIKYVWPDAQLYEDLKSPERFLSFKDSKILEIIRINDDSAESRPEYYQEFSLYMTKIDNSLK